MIRVAMLSFWHVHGKDYAKLAEEHPDTEIVAVWDENPERGQAEADQRNVPFFAKLEDLLAQPNIDGVIVDSPTSLHHEVIVASAKAGKHIFTEKVIAATLREAEEIVAAVEKAGVAFVVSMRRLTDPYAVAIRELIAQDAVGEISLVRVRDSHSGSLRTKEQPEGFLPEHFYSPKEAQGGALIDLCHPVYLTRAFLGRPEGVSAIFGHVTGRAVDDNTVVIMRYPNGAVGVAETAYVAQYSPFSIEVHGSKGSVIYRETGLGEMIAQMRSGARSFGDTSSTGTGSGPDGKLHIRSDNVAGAEKQWLVRDVPAGLPPAFDEWVTHIQNDTRATENVAFALDLTAIVEAATTSSNSGQLVRLDGLERGR
jgi:1,5-anhydro-D-fructose reductase (1,5-anhydro-D-mannitol-forming)